MTKKSPNRLLPVIAAVAIQLCLGIAYIWSVFQTGIAESIFGGDNSAAGLTFSLLLFNLSIGSVIGGKLAAKYSTRMVVILGGLILSAGFFLASFVTSSFPWGLWLSYGVMGGIGMGFTYSTSIACAQKWFPDKRGLITGIIVSALGFGGVVFTPVTEALITHFGGPQVGELKTFRVLSLVFLTVCTIGGFAMKNPPEGYFKDIVFSDNATAKSAKDFTPSQIIKTPQYYIVAITFMLACMGGLMMIGFAKPIAVAKGLGDTATIGVLLISMFNSAGRLVWGTISDRLGRMKTIIMILAGTAGLSLLVNLAVGYWIYALIACIGFFYGGLLSTFPSLTSDLWGAKNMATNYGLVLLGFGTGAIISSYVAGYYKNIAAQDISLMFPAFIIASLCATAGIVMMLILNMLNKKQSAS